MWRQHAFHRSFPGWQKILFEGFRCFAFRIMGFQPSFKIIILSSDPSGRSTGAITRLASGEMKLVVILRSASVVSKRSLSSIYSDSSLQWRLRPTRKEKLSFDMAYRDEVLLLVILKEVKRISGDLFAHVFRQRQMDIVSITIFKSLYRSGKMEIRNERKDIYDEWKDGNAVYD